MGVLIEIDRVCSESECIQMCGLKESALNGHVLNVLKGCVLTGHVLAGCVLTGCVYVPSMSMVACRSSR